MTLELVPEEDCIKKLRINTESDKPLIDNKSIPLVTKDDCSSTKKAWSDKKSEHEKGWKKRLDKINNANDL